MVFCYGSPGRLSHLPMKVNKEPAGGLVTHPQVRKGTETPRHQAGCEVPGPATELSSRGHRRGRLAEGAAQVAGREPWACFLLLCVWVSGVHPGGVCPPLQTEWRGCHTHHPGDLWGRWVVRPGVLVCNGKHRRTQPSGHNCPLRCVPSARPVYPPART